MSRTQPHYFGAGPALLPAQVLRQAAIDLLNYKESGLGLGEISHRSALAVEVVDSAKATIKQLLSVPETYEVFFLQGGGTGEFSAVVYNLLASFALKTGKKGKADYLVTGSWSQKAAEEAIRLGVDVNMAVDARKWSANGKSYGKIPDPSSWNLGNAEETAYVYYCDNETVSGVEFPYVPEVPEGVELVADMSSNILSREFDVKKFGLVFAGAQKNIGMAGVTVCIIKKQLLARPKDADLVALGIPLAPLVLDFPTIVNNNSLYNTLPIFNLHIVGLTTQLLHDNGGLKVQEALSNAKAKKLYGTLDSAPDGVYNCIVDKACRSRMNIVFTIPGEGKEKAFLDGAKARGLTGLQGHRSVGGIRVSNYNAVSDESIDVLVDWINTFAANA
ncbi:pyridoxal phosphate-dependent transferase [Lipomyces kononenkoae]|uniref:Pyridoxal phosphate-dependent transferase n=1 Tax=Lipomyces kononenkoae TaxID=34357 RepID=A0ACC3T852_LIPKO